MLEFMFESTRAVSDLLFSGVFTRYPRIQWVIPHCGGALPLLTDRIQLFRQALPGADHDPTPAQDQIRRLWFDMAGTPFPNQVPALIAAFGSDHLLYGSDYCWIRPQWRRRTSTRSTRPPNHQTTPGVR